MALQLPPEAWLKAQQLKEVGPLDYYNLRAEQHTLLETTWQALYPGLSYPCSTRSCPGRIRAAHKQMLQELAYHLSLPPTGHTAQIQTSTTVENKNATTLAAAVATAPASPRYSFAKGVEQIREFGNPIPHTKMTDELAERLLSVSPDYARLLVDSEAPTEAELLAEANAEVDAELQAEAGAVVEGAKVIDMNPGKDGQQDKLPSPSAVKQMNKEDVTAQYLFELKVAEVPAELDTNGKVAAAIIAHREKLAE